MPVTVEGVLESPPGGAGKGKGWALIFHLMPWQRKLARGEALPTKPLRVEIPMTERALHGWMARLETGDTVRVALDRVRLFDKKALWWFGIAKTGPRKIARPPALVDAALVRARKVVVASEVLGRLTLDRSIDAYVGRVALWGRKIDVSVSRSGSEDNAARDTREVEAAAKAFARIERSRRVIEKAIVREMLPLYNDNWRDRRPAITWVQLLARIRPGSLSLHSSGKATIFYRAGSLFLDHAIEVRIAATGKVSEICLAG